MVVLSASPGHVVAGHLDVLACAAPLCPHAEFAVAGVLGRPVDLQWTEQPRLPGTLGARLEWGGPAGTAGKLASALRVLDTVRFEVVEQPAPGVDAERYSYVPELGLFRADLSANGDIVVREGVLRSLLADGGTTVLPSAVHRLLGTAWDEALEPLRSGGESVPVTVLRRTG